MTNIITTNIEQQYKQLRLFPSQLLLETTSRCNLDCIMCARQFQPRAWGTMDEALARKVIDEVVTKAPWCRIWFCYFGEPLLKRRTGLFARIAYAKERGLERAAINTNGNLMDNQAIEDMLTAGLDEVYIGIDATDAATYARIRRGGNFETVRANIHRLIERAQGRIKVTVQFAVLDENEHQVDAFKQYWSQYPVDIFIRPKLTWCGYLEDKVKSESPRYPCPWIFDSININEDGRVPYCICDWANRYPLGDVAQESIVQIWQEKTYPLLVLHARRMWDKLPEFCQQCRDWQTKSPKHETLIAYFAQATD